MTDVSMAFGGMYISSSATTTLTAATPAKAAGTTSSMGLNSFSHASNKLTYTGTVTRTFNIVAALSVSAASAETMTFFIYKNGAPITGAEIDRKASNNDIGAVVVSALVSLATNDYIEVWLESLGGADLTLDYGQVIARVAG